MKRLPATLLASMISSIVALSGCSTKEETSAVHPSGSQDIANEAQTKSNKKITIRFYSYNLGNAVFGAGTQKLIDEFQASHPNISVEGVPVPITDLMTRV